MIFKLRARSAQVVFASALYDLVVTAPFATPWSARWVGELLRSTHDRWGLSGHPLILGDPHTMLFMNLMGSLVVIWSILRLRTPSRELGLADTCGRVAFATWMTYALLEGASTAALGFLVLEVLWALVQGVALLGRGIARPSARSPAMLGRGP